MSNREKKNIIMDESVEDVTQYGEFISSFHNWTGLDNQKRIANHLENCTLPEYRERVRKSSRS